MNAFDLRNALVNDYAEYVRSFLRFRDPDIKNHVDEEIEKGLLWPEPLIQLSPAFEPGEQIDGLVDQGVLHEECRRVFRLKRGRDDLGSSLRLYRHQAEGVKAAAGGHSMILTTGTGSGKSLAYIIPIVDHVLRHGSGRGIQAVIVYPMNALANSQLRELEKFLCFGYPDGRGPVTFRRYTGQETDEEKQEIVGDPPDILLTNYVMLELVLTRPKERNLVQAAQGLRFLVLDELHTYRGRQGADVAMLVRRTRGALSADRLQCIGTSATLAGGGNWADQQNEVAAVASLLFGGEVRPEHVIGESLRRVTPETDVSDAGYVRDLADRVKDESHRPPTEFEAFIEDPLAIWIESTFGLHRESGTGRLIRQTPRSLRGPGGAAIALAEATGVSRDRCEEALQEMLMAGYRCLHPETGQPVFAFRLHQFISRGDTVYASLEPERNRYITVRPQQYVPGDRRRVLLPLVFCRECGQEYYCVWREQDDAGSGYRLTPRQLSERRSEESSEPGFLYLSTQRPWPSDPAEVAARVPEEWLDERGRIRRNRRGSLPQQVQVTTGGRQNGEGVTAWYVPAPFRFCLNPECGVSYGFRQRSDFPKLTALGTEGRSTATTILSLSAVRHLRDMDLEEKAKKLLSFMDNRQDASLQAGHFNDFVQVGLLRSALYKATVEASGDGLRHEELTQRVFEALGLSRGEYASDPDVRYQAAKETDRALRNVLGYRLYRDLQRGWRITAPNLEQVDLLEIAYLSLEEVCRDEDLWAGCHRALAEASPEVRAQISKVLLDLMRRQLAIKVEYLEESFQERMVQQSSQRLVPPWGLDENEQVKDLVHAALLYPRSRQRGDYGGNVFLSSRSGFGQYLRRPGTLPAYGERLSLEETGRICREFRENRRVGGLVEDVDEPSREGDVPGYQLVASAMLWKAGEGKRPYRDAIRQPSASAEGRLPNRFFVDYYRTVARQALGIRAGEHTAQVPSDVRLEREEAFRNGTLPILYCSPTMELGIDIAELNTANMRNVPPTPANYAQRSGRAGRSGQPALIFTYCSTGSPHDQYFYKRPERMVAGEVLPPRIDLANEDLIRAHVQAIWLAETGLSLGESLKDVLDVSGDEPTLALQPHVAAALQDRGARERAKRRARAVLATAEQELASADWYSPDWPGEVFAHVPNSFEAACERWRGLYRAALRQAQTQDRIVRDASRSAQDKRQAERLRRDAEAQLRLLVESEGIIQSDFYSYRYFASEGFLPGYNFPRLPLSAYIPGRRIKAKREEFLSRPRFLAISEFGPRACVYHEGSQYVINQVILPVQDEEEDLETSAAKLCPQCGYLHPCREAQGPDLCERCGASLDAAITSLFRLQNVVTKRRQRINCDEEERLRLGYEIVTAFRFAERGGRLSCWLARVQKDGGEPLAELTYGHAATLRRINLGWRRRTNQDQMGFLLDIERGYWARREDETEDDSDPMSPRRKHVIPYVEDRKNCLIFEPTGGPGDKEMASLQSALKNAIQACYELEDRELAAEPLPSVDKRRSILLYEASEGGAGVLRRLLEDAGALRRVARTALELCHFDPETGQDLHRAPSSLEDCEAACYDCLMNYANQRDHELLDRKAIRDYLLELAEAEVAFSPANRSPEEHLERLMRLAGSELEKRWLCFLNDGGYRLPSDAQRLFRECGTQPDFVYADRFTAVYIDGPPHDFPERAERDRQQTACMEDAGWTVIRFREADDWQAIVASHASVFGGGS